MPTRTRSSSTNRSRHLASRSLKGRMNGMLAGIGASSVPNAIGRLSIGQKKSNSGSTSPSAAICAMPGTVCDYADEWRLYADNDARADVGNERRIAHELNGVAKALFVDEQNG